MEYFGIDVAKWNGNINWAKVKESGRTFAILKVTQKDNSVEPSFQGNYIGAIAAGLNVGVYRYVYATTVEAAKKEANAIVKLLKDKKIRCGVWLDLEDKSIRLSKSQLTSIIQAESTILKAAGYGVGIYCNRDWYLNVLDSKNLEGKYPFWIARYPSGDKGLYNANSTLAPKTYSVAWQYSSKGQVPGISGNVDLDVAYRDLSTLFTIKVECPYDEPLARVSKGSKGEAAAWVQWMLDAAGYPLDIDGSFGPKSDAALRKFQKDRGLVVDGICGKNTRAALKGM